MRSRRQDLASAPGAARRRRLGRWVLGLGLAAVVAAGIALRLALPDLVATRLSRALALHGFPDARFRVVGLGLEHVRLADVHLAEGLDLGDVALEAGVTTLWRGQVDRVTVRGARVTAAAIAATLEARVAARATPPFRHLRLDDCSLAVGNARVVVSGTVAWPRGGAPAIDLAARASGVHLGSTPLRALAGTARSAGDTIEVCATGQVAGAAAGACTSVPLEPRTWSSLQTLDLTWQAVHPHWSGQGEAHLVWLFGADLVVRGRAELALAADAIEGATLDHAVISARYMGPFSVRALSLEGEARADQVTLGSGAILRDVRVPLSVDAALVTEADSPRIRLATRAPLEMQVAAASIPCASSTVTATGAVATVAGRGERAVVVGDRPITWPRKIAWRATEARWRDVSFRRPSGTLTGTAPDAPHREVRWRAADARWQGARFHRPSGTIALSHGRTRHRVTWSRTTGPGPIELGQGELRFHTEPRHVHFDRGTLAALGGTLSLVPFATDPDRPIELALDVRGLQLARALTAAGSGHIRATGLLDGELQLRFDGETPSLTRGVLRARGKGGIQVRDPGLRARASSAISGTALGNRIAAALEDFEYTRLAAELDPDLGIRLVTHGRGKRVPQVIDLVVNLHGVRDVVQRLSLARIDRRSP